MPKEMRHFISLVLVSLVIGAFIIFGFVFTVLLLFAWGILELLLHFAPPASKGKIVSKGQVISVDYTVVEEKEVPHSHDDQKK